VVDLIGRLSNPRRPFVESSVAGDADGLPVADEAPVRRVRPRHQRLEPCQVAELLKGYEAGQRLDALMATFGISKDTVLRHVDRAGMPKRSESRGWSDVDLGVASTMYGEGASLAVIGELFGIGSTTVWNRLRAAGVPLRSRPGWENR